MYIAVVEALKKKERQDLYTFAFAVPWLMPYYAETGCWLFSAPNLVTLWMTLMSWYISYEICEHLNQTMQNHVGCRVLQLHPPGLIDMCSVLCLWLDHRFVQSHILVMSHPQALLIIKRKVKVIVNLSICKSEHLHTRGSIFQVFLKIGRDLTLTLILLLAWLGLSPSCL
jgi:hypothetical protein